MAKKPSGKSSSFLFLHGSLGQRGADPGRGSHGLMTHEKLHVPPMDIFESGDSLKIEIELPGVSINDMELYFIGNRLYLNANKYDTDPFCDRSSGSREVDFICMERNFGRFKREVSLPVPCNPQAARAVCRNGVLIVDIPKIPDRRGKRLDVPISREDLIEGGD